MVCTHSCVAWGKAVEPVSMEKTVGPVEKGELEEPMEEFSSVETVADNPCVYKGNIFTVDVRKIAGRIK